jgi:protein ImuB
MHWIALQPEASHSPASQGGPNNALNSVLADDLTALGWWALQFTPKVARVGAGERQALVLEVSASQRLFGGQKQLLQLIYQGNMPVALVKHAQAATSLVAIARLQLAQNGAHEAVRRAADRPADQPGYLSPEPDPLPLSTLAAATAHLATLARIGCTRWGDVRALPRGGVVRRFGAELLDALDRAYGLKPEIYPWLTLPEVFEATLELQAQVETAPALMFGAQRLLKQLQLWLQLRHCGVTALELGWTMDARRNTASRGELLLRTAEPTQDIGHLQRLMGEHLARLTLPAPVLYLHLRSLQTEPLAGASASLLIEDIQKGDSLHQMVERLSARLGPENVLQLATHADHRPERMQSWQPVTLPGQSNAIKSEANYAYSTRAKGQKGLKPSKPSTLQPDALYPSWLLHQPLALAVLNDTPHYQGPLTLLAGPQRLEAGWFDAPALRDYFVARSEQMGLLWIYRERLGGRDGSDNWYLHGSFD